jgi:hypothetical protein
MRTVRLSAGSGIQRRLLNLRIRYCLLLGAGLVPALLLWHALLPAPSAAQAQPPTRPAARPTQAGSGEAPAWTNPFPSELNTISACSGDDAWTGGSNSYLLHFVGGTATVVQAPEYYAGSEILDIKMLSAVDGWRSELEPLGYGYVLSAVSHYDGHSWNPVSGPAPYTIAPVTTNDVWGLRYSTYDNAGSPTNVLHWDGSQWITATTVTPTLLFGDIAFAAADDGWVVGTGTDDTGPVPGIVHYNGTSWDPVPAPPGAVELRSVWAGAGVAWMTGADNTGSGQIYRYQGGVWTAWATPDQGIAADIVMQDAKQGWATTDRGGVLHWTGGAWQLEYTSSVPLTSVSMAGGQVWVAGTRDTVLHRTVAGVWTHLQGGPTTQDLNSVAVLSDGDAWAVGHGGTAVHWDGANWTRIATPFTRDLYRVQMAAANDVYAVGDHIIAHWDGVRWTQVAVPGGTLSGLALTGSGQGWAVGGAEMWHLQNGVWSPATHPPATSLAAVAMDSPEHGWAVGGWTLLEWDGTTWRDRSAGLPPDAPALSDIALDPGGREGWAIGAGNGAFALHLHDGTWTSMLFGTIRDYPTGVAAEALDEAWVIGWSYPISPSQPQQCWSRHYQAGTWTYAGLPGCIESAGLALLPGRGGWAVGPNGLILRYDPLAPGQRFYDVPLANPFAGDIEYMAAHGIISGYADNTFRPYANITRGQLTKMVVAGMSWAPVTPAAPTFADVPAAHPFYSYIETAVAHGVIAGYSCGAPGEPCPGRYFRPQADVTRGQMAKIIVGAKGWGPATPATPTFVDVPATQPFYGYIEQAVSKGILSGYGCGGAGEPCPGRYYRPGGSASRGQLSKILHLALIAP